MRLLSKIKRIFAALGLLLLAACSSSDINDYAGTKPNLDLKQFFDGKLTAHGTVQDYSGKVIRRFTVDMQASWQGNQGEIKEWFVYDDGEKQIRIWNITELGGGKYTGTANDILGEAQGQAVGMALRWEYQMMLPVDDTEYQVTFDDWMFLVDENTIINRSDINKFGITMAEVTLVISKVES
ncbi:DUF3833 domain-containing protein [Shewanella sp. Isolate13]|uniref:DUF3833 domain-containing protein n=1 Tax=Shewanella sp. Isolate13 TaxID=2908531 RepID=UPI001EFDEDB7|nr:DUF3833 domain-containing protein [Shewanella sp. Isolate13]MCG9729894.1 DUF3833 domain-containing protein [Shewanella sp. Isolate13]